MSSLPSETIRKSFLDFVRRQTGAESSSVLLESTLIRDGTYVGRRFSLMGFSLIWFIDEQQVKLYGQDGGLIRSMPARDFCDIPSFASPRETRRAA